MITTPTAVFVWTLNDLFGAVFLGICVLFGLTYAVLTVWFKLTEWLRRKFK